MGRNRWRFRTMLALLMTGSLVTLAGAEAEPLTIAGTAQVVVPEQMFMEGQVLISFEPGTTELAKAEARALVGADRLQSEASFRGDLELAALPSGIDPESASAVLSQHPAVLVAEVNARYEDSSGSGSSVESQVDTASSLRPNDPLFAAQWGMGASSDVRKVGLGMPEAWDLTAQASPGGPAWVAVLDSAISVNHPDLRGRVINPGEDANGDGQATLADRNGLDDDRNGGVDDIYGWDFLNNAATVNHGENEFGSHVSGIAAAITNDAMGVSGIGGPDGRVRILGCKVSTGLSLPHAYNVTRAIRYVVDLKSRGVNVVAINMSFETSIRSAIVEEAVQLADQAGILIVASAGSQSAIRSGDDNDVAPQYPASYPSPNVIAVAALAPDGALAGFSNYGATSVDVAAPGVAILSTSQPEKMWSRRDGTSAATPHVAGLAAFLSTLEPTLGHYALRERILGTSVVTPELAGRIVAGRIDAVRAILNER